MSNIRKKASKTKWWRHHKKIMVVFLAFSFISLAFSPLGPVKERLTRQSPIIISLLFLTEALFIFGLGLMAYSVGAKLGPNILTWRRHFKTVLGQASNNKLFIVGFVINAVGAFGTGFVLSAGILLILPRSSWGLLWLPFADILVTLSVRGVVIDILKEYKSTTGAASKS